VDELALAEALQAKDLRVGGEAGGADLVGRRRADALDAALEVLCGVDVVLVDADLRELGRARQAEGVEAAVARERAVEPLGALGVGQPEQVGVDVAAEADGAALAGRLF